MEEFANEVSCVSTMRLAYDNSGVLVVWKWEDVSCATKEVTSVDQTALLPEDDEGNPSDIDQDRNEDEDAVTDNSTEQCHTVAFKCIGATRDENHQITLRTARDKYFGLFFLALI